MNIKIYDSKALVASAFASFLEHWLMQRAEAHIALSGGSTPKILFEELSKEGKYQIDWNKVHLYWGDERCVPPTDEESNYKMTEDYLLQAIEIPAGNVHRIYGEDEPQKEALRYSSLLQSQLPQNNGVPSFDMVILGMGEDGHTASIFPHEVFLWGSERNCEVATHPVSGQKRITITGKIINNSREVVFLVTGEEKAGKVASIIQKEEGYRQYPAALVHPANGILSWFLDAGAASEL